MELAVPLKPGFYPVFPLELLAFSDENARRNSVHPRHLDNLEGSYSELGFFGSLVADGNGELADAMHRTIALIRKGVTHAPVYIHSAKPDAEISISSDTQRPFSTPSQIKAIGQTYSSGFSTRTVAAAAQLSTDATRRKILFELNAIPELRVLAQAEGFRKIPFSKACEFARLEEGAQRFELQAYLQRKDRAQREPESAKELSKRISSRIAGYGKGVSLKSLRGKKPKRTDQSIDELVKNISLKQQKYPYETEELSLTPPVQQERKAPIRTPLETLYERIAKLYNVSAVKKSDLEKAQERLAQKGLAIAFNKESLYSKIRKLAKKHPVSEQVITPDQAIQEVLKENIVMHAQDADFAFLKPYKNLMPADYNAREEDVEKTCQELVESIRKNGVINPVLAHRTEKGIQLVYGHRRLAAAKKAGVTVPTIILRRRLNENELILYQLMEDSQKAYTTLELSSFYARAYHEKRANDKTRTQAIKEISGASGRDEKKVKRLIAYDRLPAFARRTYSARLCNLDTFDSLVDLPAIDRRTRVIRDVLRGRKQKEQEGQIDMFGGQRQTPDYVLAQALEARL